MILADEGLNGNIVKALRDLGIVVDWIMEISPGIKDEEVIEYARANKKFLITEDKDFGEWVFAHKINRLTIIFLRYEKKDYEQVLKYLKELVQEIDLDKDKQLFQFITINKHKVRKRVI